MKILEDWNPTPERSLTPHRGLMKWCHKQARRVQGDETLALALYQATAYGSHREGQQLNKVAVLVKPDKHCIWMRGGGLSGGDTSHTAFAQVIALHATACDARAAAIVCECWIPARPLAPGERPSDQDDRKEAVVICAQGRMNSRPISINKMLPIVDGHIAAAPKTMPEEQAMFMGLGRFISSTPPSPEQREAAQALIQQLSSRTVENLMKASAEDLAKIAVYNPSAKPPNWNEVPLRDTSAAHEEETTALKPIEDDRYYLGLWYWPYSFSSGDCLLCVSRRLSEPLDWEVDGRLRRPMSTRTISFRLIGKTEAEVEAEMNALMIRFRDETAALSKTPGAPFEFWPARCSGAAYADTMAQNPPKFLVFESLPDGRVRMVTQLIR